MRRIALLLVLLASIVTQTHAADAPRPFRVGIDDFPPYEFMEEGEPKGIDIDIIRTIMDRQGVPVTFSFYPWARSWLLLEKGKLDGIPSVSHQTFREPVLYFTDEQKAFNTTGREPSDYLWMTEYVFFINRRFSEALHFDSYKQIARDKYRVGVIKGYSYDQAFRAATLDRYVYPSQEAGLRALSEGIIDILPFDRTVGTWLIRQKRMEEQITFLPRPLFRKPYLMGFSRLSNFPDAEGLMSRFNEELRRMRENGECEAIRQRYITQKIDSEQPRAFTFVCEDWAPFEYMEGETVTGIDVDVTDTIMKRLGLPYTIQIYPWSRAWMLAQKGEADAVLSVSYKASREPLFYYTQEQREFPETGKIPSDHLWLSEYVFFIKKHLEDTLVYESYEQIKSAGYRVGRNKEYSYDQAFRDAGFDGPIFNDTRAGFLALVSGDIDLYPMDKTIGHAAMHAMGLSDSLSFLPKPLFAKPYLVTFCKKSQFSNISDIMTAFNRELRLMRQSGEYKRIYDRHFETISHSAPTPPP